MSELITQFRIQIEKQLAAYQWLREPAELYEPIEYTLQLGGKRMRPILLMLSAHLFKMTDDSAIHPACGIELFHNFTLLHDDIMDEAPLRRGKKTVHEKWNNNIAILSGDVMFVESCKLMSKVPADVLPAVLDVFYKAAIEVCEGQQFDMNFEKQANVSEAEYLKMIEMKTAALLGASLEIGGIIAKTTVANRDAIHDFGRKLGVAFQIMDDILDVYGQEQEVGKRPGGDIVSNKKTFLLIKALELANPEQHSALMYWLETKHFDEHQKVQKVKAIFDQLDVAALAKQEMENQYQMAIKALSELENVNEKTKLELIDLAEKLMRRTS